MFKVSNHSEHYSVKECDKPVLTTDLTFWLKLKYSIASFSCENKTNKVICSGVTLQLEIIKSF